MDFETFGVKLLGRLPLRSAQAVGGALGRVASWLPIKPNRVGTVNLSICLPSRSAEERDAILKRSMVSLGTMLGEAGHLWRLSKEDMLNLAVEFEGQDDIEAALAKGGVLIATPHLGCWEFLALFLSAKYGLTGMYKPQGKPIDEVMLASRSKFGANVVPANNAGVKAMIKALRTGGLVGMLPDQEPGSGGDSIFVPFFGVPANTTTLIARLAGRTKVPVFLGFAERLPKGRGYKLKFSQLDDRVYDSDLEISLSAVNERVAELIADKPEQYWWAYKRFRKRPPGMPKLYK